MTRRVIITGGGTGIGKVTAAKFAADGCAVHIVGRRPEVLARAAEEIRAQGVPGSVHTFTGDMTEPDQVRALVDSLDGQGVDVLVLNAGGSADLAETASLEQIRDHWYAILSKNLLSAVLPTEALLSHMNNPGRIVAVSSIASFTGNGSYHAYASAKGAINTWVVGLARRLASAGITINAVAPGYVPETGFWEGRTPEFLAFQASRPIPVGRPGTPQDVADAIAYFADENAGFVTGQTLNVSGGAVLARS